MPDIAALVTPPLLLDSTGAPANGDIYVRVTSSIAIGAGIVTPTQGHGKIVDGQFKALDGSAFYLPVTPDGVGVEVFIELIEERPHGHGPSRAKHTISRTVSVPNTATVTWEDLVDVVPIVSGGDYIIPPWVASVLSARTEAEDAAAEAVAAAASVPSEAEFTAEAARVVALPKAYRGPRPLVAFSFDDGYLTDLTVVKPLLDAKSIKATFGVITSMVGGSDRLSWDQVRQLRDEGHEIANHSATHASLDVATAATLATEVGGAHQTFLTNGVTPTGFIWPQSVSSTASRGAVAELYPYALGSSGSAPNVMPYLSYKLGRAQLSDLSELEDRKALVDTAITNNSILIFLTHSGTSFNSSTQALFSALVDYIKSKGVEIVTAGAAVSALGNVLEAGDFAGGVTGYAIDRRGITYRADGTEPGAVVKTTLGATTAAQIPSTFTAGKIYHAAMSTAQNTDWPVTGVIAWVTTNFLEGNAGYAFQEFRPKGSADIWRRYATSASAWSTWFAPTHTTEVADSTAVARAITAFPVGTRQTPVPAAAGNPGGGVAGLLTTDRIAGTTYTYSRQTFDVAGGGASYRRMALTATTWSAWQQVTLT